jgi:hypothetical protein
MASIGAQEFFTRRTVAQLKAKQKKYKTKANNICN